MKHNKTETDWQKQGVFAPNGMFLDGVDIKVLTHKQIGCIKSILCYGYEDDYDMDYKSIVLDLTFGEYFDDISNDHIRILYHSVATVLQDIAMMQDFEFFYLDSVRMDWDDWSYRTCKLPDERKDEFDEFINNVEKLKRQDTWK